ncbi:4648_t:CDS:2 [Paraglomus brasilianum]|uniref:4648_t:CDS:1 n=1 Tax=Paraglomus brasilianum TaxID=144538 RepID=A0A9N9FGB9_9GLOM|nr:4648_t:CDS:2 [Paraglomus brasilianum]
MIDFTKCFSRYANKKTLSEPAPLLFLRVSIAIFISITFISYIVYLLIAIKNDAPVLRFTQETLTKMEIPDIEICSDNSDVIITKCIFYMTGFQNNQYYDNCTTPEGINYLIPGNKANTRTFCYLFTTNKTIHFPQSSEHGVIAVEFLFKIANLTASVGQGWASPAISIQPFHPDFNPLWRPPPNTPKAVEFENELRGQKNSFSGIQNYVTKVSLRQSKFRAINHKTFRSVLGLDPIYFDYFFFDVDSKYFPVEPGPAFSPTTNTGVFSIQPQSFEQEVKEQQRSRTLLSSLGLTGGAFGVLFGLYTVLFGASRLKPWGIFHRTLIKRTQISNQLQSLPLVSPVQSSTLTLSSSERTMRLENRVQELEELLQDYFLDTSYLRKVGKNAFGYKEDERVVIIDNVQKPSKMKNDQYDEE